MLFLLRSYFLSAKRRTVYYAGLHHLASPFFKFFEKVRPIESESRRPSCVERFDDASDRIEADIPDQRIAPRSIIRIAQHIVLQTF